MTTYAQFVSALAAMNVTGVKRRYDAPPRQISTADLPASYPRLPSGQEGPLTAQGQGGWPHFSAEYVILVEPVGQGQQAVNFASAVALIDNLSAAFRTAALAKGKNTWTIRQAAVAFSETTAFWAIIATVSANG